MGKGFDADGYWRPPLPIGRVVEPYGKIKGYRTADGERYYFLQAEDGAVAYIPADVIERIAK